MEVTPSDHPRFHHAARCGKFKRFTTTKTKIITVNGKQRKKSYHIRWKHCYKHNLNVCAGEEGCGWEMQWHYGTFSPLLNPPSAYNQLTNKKLWDK